MLKRLDIINVRNLQRAQMRDLGRVSVFSGPNGSGKTSILESVHLLGMARSFRGSSIKSLITHGESACTVYGQLSRGGDHGGSLSLGIQRGLTGEVQIKVAGQAVKTVAQLVEHLPVQVINADSFNLLTGAPGARRQFMDWGVFHVEHGFYPAWQRFQRCIKQRNKLLRRGKMSGAELSVWTRDLAQSGSEISQYRRDYFSSLAPRFYEVAASLSPTLEGLELRFRQGWDKELDYAQALQNSEASDREQGYTHVGPQRADLRVVVDGHVAADTLSRGQQKIVVCALKLAQGQLMAEQIDRVCTYLVDDLPSELDRRHSRLVCEQLAAMGSQVLITCIDGEEIHSLWPGNSSPEMFHVEHGVVSR